MKVLVTGANGFIGSHLAEELLRRGYEVYALLRGKKRWLPEGVKVLLGDLRGELPELRGFHHVFHLAALTRAKKPREYFEVNTKGTERLARRILEGGGITGKFVFLSSLSAQGPTRPDRPLTEEVPPRPISPYGESKLRAEEALKGLAGSLPVVILRPAIVYGPRDDYMIEFFRILKRGFLPLLRDGQWLSMCYVEDVVQALVLASEKEIPSGEVFLLSDGSYYPLQGIADMVASILGVRIRRIRIPVAIAKTVAFLSEAWGKARGYPPPFNRNKLAEALQEAWICDNFKARKILGFEPRYPLEEGLKLTLRWYQEVGWL